MSCEAVIYVRFSPRPDADTTMSNKKQIERCEEYCSRQGYHVYSIFEDEAETGGVMDRPMLVRAIANLQEGEILVVDRTDRLARSVLVGALIRQEVEAKGCKIEFADGTPCGDSPEDRLIQDVFMAIAAFERNRIKSWTKRALAKKRKACKPYSGNTPIGWQKVGVAKGQFSLVKNTNEISAIRLMFWLKEKFDLSASEIARRVTAECGLCRGKNWNHKTVKRMLKKHSFWAATDGDPSLEPSCPI